jgi:hypothetical protein
LSRSLSSLPIPGPDIICKVKLVLEPLSHIALNHPVSCDPRNHAYKNGKTFEDCKAEARRITSLMAEQIGKSEAGEVSWNKILEVTNNDELVYKLTLKYLREKGYDIGNNKNPRVKVEIVSNRNRK